MAPYHIPHKQASNRTKKGLQAIPTNDYLSSELIYPADFRSNGRQAPKYLFLSGSQDWDGGWDNAVKILEG